MEVSPPETDYIRPDEWVLRKFPAAQQYYNEASAKPVLRTAFEPNQNDRRGIWVFRERYHTAEDVVSMVGKGKPCYVVRIKVRDIENSGMTVVSDPTSVGKGHALIPETNYEEREHDWKTSRKRQQDMANLIHARDVIGPFNV